MAGTKMILGAKGTLNVYGRTRRGVKKGTKRGPYKTKSNTTLTQEVATIKRTLKKTKPEVMYWTRNGVLSNLSVTSSGSVHSMCLAAEEDDGATPGTPARVGNEITWLRGILKGYIRWNANTDGQILTVKIVRMKKQTPDTYPTFANIYEGADSNYGLIKDKADTKNFQFLYTQRFVQNTSIGEIPVDISVDFKGIKSKFNGPLSTDIEENGIYFMIQSNQGTNYPVVSLNERVLYYQ